MLNITAGKSQKQPFRKMSYPNRHVPAIFLKGAWLILGI